MPWLARLDARAKEWPAIGRLAYGAARWYLVLGGIVLICGLAFAELQEKRVGLGTGVVVAVLLGCIKGVTMAVKRHR